VSIATQNCSKVNPAIVTDIVDACLTDPLNRWDMQHYRERIDVYYDFQAQKFAGTPHAQTNCTDGFP
jgi:hypothetical protein